MFSFTRSRSRLRVENSQSRPKQAGSETLLADSILFLYTVDHKNLKYFLDAKISSADPTK